MDKTEGLKLKTINMRIWYIICLHWKKLAKIQSKNYRKNGVHRMLTTHLQDTHDQK